MTAGGGYIFRCPLEAGHVGEHRYFNPTPLFHTIGNVKESHVVTGEDDEQSTAQA